jgi:hypothetical protein
MLMADRSLRAISSLGVTALLALGSLATTGCGAIAGEHDQSIDFLVLPNASDHSFNGWTDITVGADVSSVGVTNLYGVTLAVKSPSTVTDLTFLSTLTGTAAGTPVAHLDSFPRDQTTVSMHVDYLGDLRPLFENSNTIRIVWTGQANPAFTDWPAGNTGIWVEGDVFVNIQ